MASNRATVSYASVVAGKTATPPTVNTVSAKHAEKKEPPRGRQEQRQAPLVVHRREWLRQQEEMKGHVQLDDSAGINLMKNTRRGWNHRQLYVAGVDISFVRNDDVNACAALTVLTYPQLKPVYVDTVMVKLTAPYIAGFLGFREVPHYTHLLTRLQSKRPDLKPEAILVDGNGALHPRGFGSACQLGVESGIPCIGVGKKLHHVDGIGHQYEEERHMLKKTGNRVPLVGKTSETVLGMALLTPKTNDPIFVSTGHKVSLNTAVQIVLRCSRSRIPEPIRLADWESRQYIRNNW